MTQEGIKNVCDVQYAIIKYAENTLKDMRELCKHPNTFEGNYSWRVGCIDPATICSDCGHVLKIHYKGREIIHEGNVYLVTSTSETPTKPQ